MRFIEKQGTCPAARLPSKAFIILGHFTQLGKVQVLDAKAVWIQGSLCTEGSGRGYVYVTLRCHFLLQGLVNSGNVSLHAAWTALLPGSFITTLHTSDICK